MKVTKLTNGYRIRCNDGEFAALKAATTFGARSIPKGELQGRAIGFSRSVRFQQEGGPLATVDEVKKSDDGPQVADEAMD
jgi:hypothetical protein